MEPYGSIFSGLLNKNEQVMLLCNKCYNKYMAGNTIDLKMIDQTVDLSGMKCMKDIFLNLLLIGKNIA